MRIFALVLATAAAFATVASTGPVSAQTLGSAFTYQGTFADGGVPANGTYDFEFALFGDPNVAAVETVTNLGVIVAGGLINTEVQFSPANYNGQVKSIEVHVRPTGGGSFTVLAPRQSLTAVPYALGLPMPFSRVVNTGSAPSFEIQNADGGNAISGIITANSGFAAISGNSFGGPGVNGASNTSAGVRGTSESNDGVRGLSTNSTGVHGVGSPGVWGEGGILATDNISCNTGSFCQSVVNISNQSVGNMIIATAAGNDVFRVNGNGSVFANGGFQASGADLAEHVPSSGTLEAGDVVEIDAEHGGEFHRSSHSNSTAVAGVISTKPGMTLNGSMTEDEKERGLARLALSGRVPVKATSENGAIRAGDLLVSSSSPGHAMRAPESPRAGSVIGKAMQKLDQETGEIEMLVMLR